MKLGVLVSGSGTNLAAILDATATGRLSAKVAVVVSNVATAYGLERAERANVPTAVVDHRAFANREEFDAELVRTLKEHGVDCVVLAGFMRVVTRVLLDAFPRRVVNIHPSLLPAFPGVHAQRQALEYGVRVAGCTVHFVDDGMDTGPIIAQRAVFVAPDDTEATLKERILREEHALLPEVLQWLADDRVYVEARSPRPVVFVRPPSNPGASARANSSGTSER
ncbi:MAG: phosphoribosylglycinamide formyltransferase [Myxococcales bacterium]|nr:phosphoribosylglycinamide formyltransferase [Myxococcales bacterium]